MTGERKVRMTPSFKGLVHREVQGIFEIEVNQSIGETYDKAYNDMYEETYSLFGKEFHYG